MAGEGQTQKLEVVRGIAATIAFWPRLDGALVEATTPTVAVFDPAGLELAAPAATQQQDGSVTFPWTPGAELALAEDYRYEVRFTAEGGPRVDVVYFDLVRVALTCPVDDRMLEAREPLLRKHLAALQLQDASQFIRAAWAQVVARVRGLGFRPALITDRHAFAEPCILIALEQLMTALRRRPDDLFERKAESYAGDQAGAWNAIGTVKFASETTGAVEGRKRTQPRFRI